MNYDSLKSERDDTVRDGAGFDAYGRPGDLIDSQHPKITAYARRVAGEGSERDKALRLYYSVRDDLRYDPYNTPMKREAYRASTTLAAGHGYCVNKAGLMAAVCRAVGIPARVGYADVRNHMTTKRLSDLMGSDTFYYHGYTEVWLDGRWVKATPAFNKELTERFGLKPLEWDGVADSIYHPFDLGGRRHMEYLGYRGVFADIPFDEIRGAFHEFAVIANAGFAFQVETHAHVNAAVAEMPVERGLVAVFVEKLADIAEIGAHFFRSDRSVIPAFPFRRRSRRRCCRARAGFAYLPNPLGLAVVVKTNVGFSWRLSEEIREFESQLLSLVRIIAPKFDEQDASSVGKQFEIGRALLAESINDAAFKSFEPDGTEFEDRRNLFGGDENVRVAQSNQGSVLGTVNQPQFGFEDGDASAFSPDESARYMEAIFGQKLIQIVARHTPRNFGIACANQLAILLPNRPKLCVDVAAAAALSNDGIQFFF